MFLVYVSGSTKGKLCSLLGNMSCFLYVCSLILNATQAYIQEKDFKFCLCDTETFFSFSVVVINLQKIVDRTTGLFTMTSSLQYMPTKEDVNAKFSCIVTYYGPSGQKTMQSEPLVFDVHCKLSKSIFCWTKSTSELGES